MDSSLLNSAASLLYPRCLVPTFLLPSADDAWTCGVIKAQILSLVLGGTALYYLHDPSYISLFAGIIFWVLLSLGCGIWSMQLWHGYQYQRIAYHARGFSEQHAVLCMHHLFVGSTVPSLPNLPMKLP